MSQAASIDRHLMASILLAIWARGGVFLCSIWWPINNERGLPTSPALPPSYNDYQFYLESMRRYVTAPADVVHQFLQFYGGDAASRLPELISGPVFPLLMWVTGYENGNYLLLSSLYLVMGCGLAAAWLYWLRRQGVGFAWLCVFAVVPNPVWFILAVSTDLLFAAEFAVFFLAYFSTEHSRGRTLAWSTALVAMVLTRPNSFAILLFVALDAALSFHWDGRIEWRRALGCFALLLLGGVFLYPYFVAELGKAAHALQYFGYSPYQYLAGLDLPLVPHWLSVPLSWAALLVAKLLYFTGLRPSYGVTADLLVALRALPGILLLPGLLLLLVRAPFRIRLMVALYCLPFIVGPAQDRYYIAIFPLFFLYGVQFWNAGFGWACRQFVHEKAT